MKQVNICKIDICNKYIFHGREQLSKKQQSFFEKHLHLSTLSSPLKLFIPERNERKVNDIEK